jgi:hypothetical protein
MRLLFRCMFASLSGRDVLVEQFCCCCGLAHCLVTSHS